MILLLVLICCFSALLHIPTCKETNHEHHSFLKEHSVFHHTILTIIFQDIFSFCCISNDIFRCQTIRWFKNTEDFLLRVYQRRFAFPVTLKLMLDRKQLCVLHSLPMHGHTRAHTQTHIKQSKPISQGGVRGQMSADFKKSDELAFCFEQKQQNLSKWCCWVKADVSRSVNGINKNFSLLFFLKRNLN